MATDRTTTQENKPWGAAEGYYKNLYSKAQKAFEANQNNPFTGELWAGPNQTQRDAVAGVKTAAGQMTGAEDLRALALSQINGDWLTPDKNPYIKDVVAAATRPMQEAFDKNRLSITDQAIAQGAYGGARQDLEQLKALEGLTRNVGDMSSGIYAQNYANERNIQQNSGNLLDQANLLSLAGPTALAGAGATEQSWDQGALDAALAKWKLNQQQPWAGMNEFANILGSGGFGTTSTTTPAPNPILGVLQGLMGGATTGASMGMGIGGLTAGAGLGAFAPWMLPFAALGGLAGGLG
jgi:hypothetical protein